MTELSMRKSTITSCNWRELISIPNLVKDLWIGKSKGAWFHKVEDDENNENEDEGDEYDSEDKSDYESDRKDSEELPTVE